MPGGARLLQGSAYGLLGQHPCLPPPPPHSVARAGRLRLNLPKTPLPGRVPGSDLPSALLERTWVHVHTLRVGKLPALGGATLGPWWLSVKSRSADHGISGWREAVVCLQAVNALPAPCHPTLLPHPPLALTDGYCPAREGLCPLSSPETPRCGRVSSEGTRFVCGPAVLCGGGWGRARPQGRRHLPVLGASCRLPLLWVHRCATLRTSPLRVWRLTYVS